MPRELTFLLDKTEYKTVPVKVDRKKLYGWTEIVAEDAEGRPARLVSTDETGRYIIPKGGTGLAILTADGEWVERSQLINVTEDGSPADMIASSFEAVNLLSRDVSTDEFLDHSITDFYQLTEAPEELIEAVGNRIYTFEYCYVGECEGRPAFVLVSDGRLFLLIGYRNDFQMLGLEQPGWIDPADTDDEQDSELDFSMF